MRQLYIKRQAIAVEYDFVSTLSTGRETLNARVCQVERDPKSARCDDTWNFRDSGTGVWHFGDVCI